MLSVPRLGRNLLQVFARFIGSANGAVIGGCGRGPRRGVDCAAVLIRPVMYDDLVTEVRRIVKRINGHQPT